MANAFQAINRISYLDGIRGAAALLVMVSHYWGHNYKILLPLGPIGVELFFVLSGFLITGILLNARNSDRYYAVFYGRRAVRIFPLYYAYLFFHFYLFPWFSGDPVVPFKNQVWSYAFLENISQTFFQGLTSGPGHFWSLAVEEQFYLVWPLFVRRCGIRTTVTCCLLVVAFAPVLRYILYDNGVLVYSLTITRADSLALGALVALSVHSSSSIGWKLYRILGLVGLLGIAVIGVFYRAEGAVWVQALRYTFGPLFFAGVIAECVSPLGGFIQNSLRYLFSLSPLVFAGVISYSLYVWHLVIFRFFEGCSWGGVWKFLAAWGGVLICAILSYYTIESPFMRLRKYLNYGPR